MDSSVRGDSTKNNEYWKQRFELLENSQYDKSAAYYKDIQKQFRIATNNMQLDIEKWYQRLADNNGVSYAAAKKLLSKNELDEFHWSVEEYIKRGKENAINKSWMKQLENASAKVHISRLEAMKLQMQQHAELLFTQYEGGTGEFLNKSFQNAYYHTAYEVAKGTRVGTNLHRIDTQRINEIIRQPWAQDGANFSDRIWGNKEKLVNTLHNELTQNIIRGTSPRVAIDNIARTMEVSRSQAGVLVMTESAAIASAAQQKCFGDLNVEEYEIVATLDSKTSQICQDLDGMHFPMKDYRVGVTAPPFHPRCRTTTVPYFDDEFTEGEERAARDTDGKTYDVPSEITYEEWMNTYQSGKGLKANDKEGIEFDRPIYEKSISNINEKQTLEELKKFERNHILDKIENACIITRDGDVYSVSGNEYSVNPLSLGKKLEGCYMTHNHPAGETHFSFSADDIAMFLDYDLSVLRGVDEKYFYQISRTDDTIKESGDMIRHLFSGDYYWKMVEKSMLGTIDIDYDDYHEIVQMMAKDYGFKYERWLKDGL